VSTGDRLNWRTSSYTQGNNCVEVGVAGDWRTSTYTDGNNCVEVAPGSAGSVYLRHSKHREAGTILLGAADWTALVDAACERRVGSVGTVGISTDGTDTLITRQSDGFVLRYDQGEWGAFVAGALDGEFSLTALAA
jgi:hypothetical protein